MEPDAENIGRVAGSVVAPNAENAGRVAGEVVSAQGYNGKRKYWWVLQIDDLWVCEQMRLRKYNQIIYCEHMPLRGNPLQD